MQWITAILAFCVTMLVFAIITTSLVEMIHRIFDMRSAGLKLMLQNVYSRVISPHLPDDKITAEEFADIIMENRATAGSDNNSAQGFFSRNFTRLTKWMLKTDKIADVPVEVFTQKLADSRIVKEASAITDDVLADISQKYEAIGREATIFFERRARLISVVVSIVVAFLFFVHPYRIATAYIGNPDLAAKVAAQAERVQDDYEDLIEKIAENEGADADSADVEELKAAINDLGEELKAGRERTEELAAIGVPVGWPTAGFEIASCFGSAKVGSENSGDSGSANEMPKISPDVCSVEVPFPYFGPFVFTVPTFVNAFWLFIGGLLVGLGAPFWSRAIGSLTAARGVTERITEIVAPYRKKDDSVEPELPASGGVALAASSGGAVESRSVPASTFKLSRMTEEKKVDKK